MDKKKIIQSVLLLLPAGVVGIAGTLGLSLHPVDIVAADNIAEVSQVSGDTSELNSVVETAQPEEVSRKTDTSSLTKETSMSESSRTSSSKQEKESSVESSKERSSASQKPAQQSSQRTENSQSSKNESSKVTERSTPITQTSVPQESSQTSVQQTSSSPKTEESRQSSSEPVQESSTAPIEVSEISEESSYTPEKPTGRYIDGTYKAAAEVDGFEEEGFLYELEVTVTVSEGEITSISGRIKNDRSEDSSSNEAYVRRAVKKLSDVIIANQGTNGVDVISNATYSSNAVLKATSDAIAQAER